MPGTARKLLAALRAIGVDPAVAFELASIDDALVEVPDLPSGIPDVVALIRMHADRCEYSRALSVGIGALAAHHVGGVPDTSAAPIFLALSIVERRRGGMGAATHFAARALATANPSSRVAELARVEYSLCHTERGLPTEGLAIAEAIKDDGPQDIVAMRAASIATAHLELENYADAYEWYRRASEGGHAGADGDARSFAGAAEAAARAGRPRAAMAEIRRAERAALQASQPSTEMLVRFNAGTAFAALGHRNRAETCYRQTLEIAERVGDERKALACRARLADLAVRKGDFSGARRESRIARGLQRRVAPDGHDARLLLAVARQLEEIPECNAGS